MTKLGLHIAADAIQQNDLTGVINEMLAFEQAHGRRPEQLFYRYPLTSEQMQHMNRDRLIVKRDGLVCLSRLGRDVARLH